MARAGIPRAKMSILSSCKEAGQNDRHYYSKFSVLVDDHHHHHQTDKNLTGVPVKDDKKSSSSTNWVPHPRSGIYFPQGHEWVMDDVPKGAASFGPTYWLRNEDGVEKPDPDDRHWDSNFHANM